MLEESKVVFRRQLEARYPIWIGARTPCAHRRESRLRWEGPISPLLCVDLGQVHCRQFGVILPCNRRALWPLQCSCPMRKVGPAVCKRSKGRCPGIGVIHSTHKLRTPRTMSAVPRPPRRPAKRGPPSRGVQPKFWAPSRNFCPTSTYLDHQLRDVRLDVREEARSDVIAPLLIFAQKLPHI